MVCASEVVSLLCGIQVNIDSLGIESLLAINCKVCGPRHVHQRHLYAVPVRAILD